MEPKNYFKVFCTYLIVIHYYQASKNKDSYINLLNHLAFASTALPNIFPRTSTYFFANTSLFSAMGWPSHLILSNFTNNSLVCKQCSTAIRRNGIAGLESCCSETLGRVLRSKASKNKDSWHEYFFSYVFVACAEKTHNTIHLKLRISSIEHQYQWN